MGRKLYRYRSFNTEVVNGYIGNDKKDVSIEKWKIEAFEGLVYPSSPLYFNDPYDCDFCFQSYVLENILDRKTYIHIIEKRFKLNRLEKNRLLYSDDIKRAVQMVLEAHGANLSRPWEDILARSLKNSMNKFKDAVRVVCLSEVYDSLLMWSHYAQNHMGYCIEYNFEETDIFYKHLYPVIYTKDRYSISENDLTNENKEFIRKSTCYKAEVWSYEKEWRIVIPNINKVMPKEVEHPNEEYILDLKNNIKAIYLGAKISDKFKDKMIQFGKTNNVEIYKMILSPKKYKLAAEKI